MKKFLSTLLIIGAFVSSVALGQLVQQTEDPNKTQHDGANVTALGAKSENNSAFCDCRTTQVDRNENPKSDLSGGTETHTAPSKEGER